MWCRYVVAIFLSIFLSRNRLRNMLAKYIDENEYKTSIQFSGRVAIFNVASSLLEKKVKIALVPRYICNVVPMAIERSGLDVVFYETNDKFEPNREELINNIKSYRNCALVICPLYGATGGASLLLDKNFVSVLSVSNVTVVIDGCQNFLFIKKLMNTLNDLDLSIFFVGSFNNKNVPGLMGGFISAKEEHLSMLISQYSHAKLVNMLVFGFRKYAPNIIRAAIRTLRRKRKDQCGNRYEYSSAKSFPYEIINYRPLRIQIAIAWLGLRMLHHYHEEQRRFISAMARNILILPETGSSSHLIWRGGALPNATRTKKTYACYKDLNISPKPELIVIENNGFS